MIDEPSSRSTHADGGPSAAPTVEVGGWPGIRVAADVGPPVRCATCGCALYPDPTPSGEPVWYHFAPARGRDARGCRIECLTAGHRSDGRPLASSRA
jgi:hypothetical protein